MSIQILPLLKKQASLLANLAELIWYEYYPPIIGKKQVTYMLQKFQSASAITQQMQRGDCYFLVQQENQVLGYFSVQLREKNSLFISKFYLSKSSRGKGIGKEMFHYIEQLAQTKNCKTLDLTVNKNNPAYKIYLNFGFTNQGAIKFNIGNGYFMDDYAMSKMLEPKIQPKKPQLNRQSLRSPLAHLEKR